MATGGQLEAKSEEFIKYECTVCLKDHKIKNADRYCFDCQKYMCPECLEMHNFFGDKHNVLSVTDTRVQTVLTEKCEVHPDKVLEYFCRQHDVVACQACYLLDHRKCDDVKNICESVDELSADPDIQAFPGQIDSALDHANQIIEKFDTHIKHIEREKDKFLEDLEEFAKSILSKIEEMRKRGKDDITALHQRITSKAKEKLDACVQAKDDLSKTSEEIKQSIKRNAHLIVLIKRSKKIPKQTETLCNESKQMIEETEFGFRRNNRLSDLLAQFNSLLEESTKPMEQPTTKPKKCVPRQVKKPKIFVPRHVKTPEDISPCEKSVLFSNQEFLKYKSQHEFPKDNIQDKIDNLLGNIGSIDDGLGDIGSSRHFVGRRGSTSSVKSNKSWNSVGSRNSIGSWNSVGSRNSIGDYDFFSRLGRSRDSHKFPLGNNGSRRGSFSSVKSNKSGISIGSGISNTSVISNTSCSSNRSWVVRTIIDPIWKKMARRSKKKDSDNPPIDDSDTNLARPSKKKDSDNPPIDDSDTNLARYSKKKDSDNPPSPVPIKSPFRFKRGRSNVSRRRGRSNVSRR